VCGSGTCRRSARVKVRVRVRVRVRARVRVRVRELAEGLSGGEGDRGDIGRYREM
jgi:hypothetical protein